MCIYIYTFIVFLHYDWKKFFGGIILKIIWADLVVYGKIFISEENQIVEAFAVKDGKFIYVGNKSGANAFIEDGKKN